MQASARLSLGVLVLVVQAGVRAEPTAGVPVSGRGAHGTLNKPGCATNDDCLLLGQCVQGVCQCRQGFTGPECGQIDLAPASPHLGYMNASANSWGGLPVSINGSWHLYLSVMRGGCPLGTFNNNSEIAHLVSDAGWDGPYRYRDTVVPSFAHNAAPRVLADGSIGIWFIGYDGYVDPIQCPSGVAPPNDVWPDWTGKQIAMVQSPPGQPNGPWTSPEWLFPHPKLPEDWWNWDCSATNPSAMMAADGSVRMMYRGTMCTHCDGCPSKVHNASERLGIAIAPAIGKPYGRPAVPLNFGNASMEDPFYWQGADGVHHLIAHEERTVCPDGGTSWCGVVASSADGVNWRLATAPAYGPNVTLTNGTTIELFARQRPQLLFGTAANSMAERPLLGLANGAELADGTGSFMTRDSFTLLQPVNRGSL